MYVGPSQLLVTIDVEPCPELSRRPGAELLERVGDLRRRLLERPSVAAAVVTLVPSTS